MPIQSVLQGVSRSNVNTSINSVISVLQSRLAKVIFEINLCWYFRGSRKGDKKIGNSLGGIEETNGLTFEYLVNVAYKERTHSETVLGALLGCIPVFSSGILIK